MSRLSEITQEQRDRLSENATRIAFGGLPFIVYSVDLGKFFMGGNKDVTDMEFVAGIDRYEAVWIYFPKGGLPPEELLRVNLMDQKPPSRPKGYGKDEIEWDVWKEGKSKGDPKDPLSLQFELPLIQIDDDYNQHVVILKVTTKLVKEAVDRVIKAANAQDEFRRPILVLEVNPSPENKHLMIPDLVIINYSDETGDIVLPSDKLVKPSDSNGNGSTFDIKPDDRITTGRPASNGGNAPTKKNADMDDDIPF